MMPVDGQEFGFSEPWLKSIENSKQDIHLLHRYNESNNQDYLNFKSDVVATFYGGSRQSTLLLKYAMTKGRTAQEISAKLVVMNDKIILCLEIVGAGNGLETTLKEIISKEKTHFKQITISDCTLKVYFSRTDPTPVSQLIKRIIFRNCKMDLSPLKAFLKEFESLDYIEFDSCTFSGDTDIKSIDISNTDVKSIAMVNFRKMVSGQIYSDDIQTVISILVYFSMQDLTRYFYVVDDYLIENTKRTFEIFRGKFNNNEVVVLDIKVKSLQHLSLQLTETSKTYDITFSR